jgi:hypothetical protein
VAQFTSHTSSESNIIHVAQPKPEATIRNNTQRPNQGAVQASMIHCLVLAQECDRLVECPEQVPEEIPMPFGVPEVSEVLPEHVCQN